MLPTRLPAQGHPAASGPAGVHSRAAVERVFAAFRDALFDAATQGDESAQQRGLQTLRRVRAAEPAIIDSLCQENADRPDGRRGAVVLPFGAPPADGARGLREALLRVCTPLQLDVAERALLEQAIDRHLAADAGLPAPVEAPRGTDGPSDPEALGRMMGRLRAAGLSLSAAPAAPVAPVDEACVVPQAVPQATPDPQGDAATTAPVATPARTPPTAWLLALLALLAAAAGWLLTRAEVAAPVQAVAPARVSAPAPVAGTPPPSGPAAAESPVLPAGPEAAAPAQPVAAAPLADPRLVAQIDFLLARADAAYAARRLTEPFPDSAAANYLAVLALDAGNAAATEGLGRVVALYDALAREALAKGDTARARLMLARAESVAPGSPVLAELRALLGG